MLPVLLHILDGHIYDPGTKDLNSRRHSGIQLDEDGLSIVAHNVETVIEFLDQNCNNN